MGPNTGKRSKVVREKKSSEGGLVTDRKDSSGVTRDGTELHAAKCESSQTDGRGRPKKGSKFQVMDRYSQETGSSRKVDSTRARELDMMEYRHSFLGCM